MKRIVSLDILKYVCILLVINIHMELPGRYEWFLSPLLTIAVPIFFMITGFFYAQTCDAGKMGEQIKKIAIFALGANMTHIGWEIFKQMRNGKMLYGFLLEVIEPSALVNLLMFNQPVWRTSLWYINALLYVLLFVCLFQNTAGDKLHKLYPLIPILLVGNLVMGTYSSVLFHEPYLLCYSRNFLLCGLPYFLLGDALHHYSDRIDVSRKWLFAGFVVFGLVAYGEEWILESRRCLVHRDHLLSTVFLCICVFLLFLKNEQFFGSKVAAGLAVLGQRYSFLIYVTHSIIIELFYKVIPVLTARVPQLTVLLNWGAPIIVLFCATVLSACLKKVPRKTKRKLLF